MSCESLLYCPPSLCAGRCGCNLIEGPPFVWRLPSSLCLARGPASAGLSLLGGSLGTLSPPPPPRKGCLTRKRPVSRRRWPTSPIDRSRSILQGLAASQWSSFLLRRRSSQQQQHQVIPGRHFQSLGSLASQGAVFDSFAV